MYTLMAVRYAREQGARTLSICNTQGATIPRESDAVLYTHAGPEVAVASTKAFVAQVTALYLLGLHIAAYSRASAQGGHELERTRKLLLHAHEIDEIKQRVDQEHLTLVPLSLYFKGGRAKLELGLGRGRKHYDKRQVIARRDADLDAKRAMAARRRGV